MRLLKITGAIIAFLIVMALGKGVGREGAYVLLSRSNAATSSRPTLLDELHKVSSALNAQAPFRIDKLTSFERATVMGGDTLVYRFKLDVPFEQINATAMRTALSQKMPTTCANKTIRHILDMGGVSHYGYYSSDNRWIATFGVNKADCENAVPVLRYFKIARELVAPPQHQKTVAPPVWRGKPITQCVLNAFMYDDGNAHCPPH